MLRLIITTTRIEPVTKHEIDEDVVDGVYSKTKIAGMLYRMSRKIEEGKILAFSATVAELEYLPGSEVRS